MSPENILLIDKPLGITSFTVVQKIRRQFNIKKVGHAGTLDPLATGLMIVGIGSGTKLLTQYIKLPKIYEAEICIGEKSTTGDREGEIIEKVPVTSLSDTHVLEVLQGMVGTLLLPVSIYSAVKKGGEALYKKARRGENVTPPIREMEVYTTELLTTEDKPHTETQHVHVRFFVGSGTYIRSLAEELGARLGYPARLENLRRTRIGDFDIKDAQRLE
jgi:tRNA pseudouridine55 synthase